MRFNKLLNNLLLEYNAKPTEGVVYQQYFIMEKKGYYYIFNESNDRIIGSGISLKEVKEKIDTIVSGC